VKVDGMLIEHTFGMIYSPKTMDKKIDEGYEALYQ